MRSLAQGGRRPLITSETAVSSHQLPGSLFRMENPIGLDERNDSFDVAKSVTNSSVFLGIGLNPSLVSLTLRVVRARNGEEETRQLPGNRRILSAVPGHRDGYSNGFICVRTDGLRRCEGRIGRVLVDLFCGEFNGYRVQPLHPE